MQILRILQTNFVKNQKLSKTQINPKKTTKTNTNPILFLFFLK